MSTFDDAWSDFEWQAGPLLVDEMSEQAPIGDPMFDPDSGTLADSMDWDDDNGTLLVLSRDPRGPIAAYVTRGTAPHEIVPVNANSLHWYGPGGEDVFAQHVDHPGTSANPFHITAWENKREEVHQLFRERVGSGVTLSYLNPWRNRTLGSEE